MKFYDVKGKKSVNISDKSVSYITKKAKGRTIKMATAKGPKGNKLYKIVK